jgi:TetR/AcrR family transcriptional repressor of nem operon
MLGLNNADHRVIGETFHMKVKGEKIRESVLNAADHLFYVKGFSETSFADIADKAGVPKGNFYYYFQSKDELLDAVVDRRIEALSDRLKLWDRNNDPRRRIEMFLSSLVEDESQQTSYGCPYGSLCIELAKTRRDLLEKSIEMLDVLRKWLAFQLRAAVVTTNADALALHLLSRVQGIVLISAVYADPNFLRREIRQLRAWLDALPATESKQVVRRRRKAVVA